MKLINFSDWAVLIFSLAACSPANTATVQVTAPVYTLPAPADSQAPVQALPATATEFVAPLTPTEKVMLATQTVPITSEMIITETQIVTITIVYDNNPYDPRLTAAWGFSALIEYRDYNLLFDTGGDGQILLENMRLLGIDPAQLDSVVLSHAHDDHTGGLISLFNAGAKPVVYLLNSFPLTFKRQVEQYTSINEISAGQFITEGIWITGEIGDGIREQALVIQTERGLVVITGCAHPGIVKMVKHAQERLNAPILLVLGGFHLVGISEAEIETIVSDFEQMGVEQVGPCHCTGEAAIARFSSAYGDNFIKIGVGSIIHLENTAIK